MTRGLRVAAVALLLTGCASPSQVEIAEAPAPAVSESRSPDVTANHPQTLRAAARSLRDGAGYQAVRRIDRTHALVNQRDGDALPVFVVERSDFGWYAYTALVGPADRPVMQAEFERAADPSFRPTDG